MINIVDRLRFDAVRCEEQFSKGVAGNITEAADEIERLQRWVYATARSLADSGLTLEQYNSITKKVVDLFRPVQ